MEENRKDILKDRSFEKIEWETPKLYLLDKGRTEGGVPAGIAEDDSYTQGSVS